MRTNDWKNRYAYTLFELLLVLALIVVILALGMPSINRMWSRSQIGNASQNVRTELYQTRLAAMKAGEAYVFRFRPGTGTYEILPKSINDDENRPGQDGRFLKSLPGNVVFERGILHTKATESPDDDSDETLESPGARATTFSQGTVTYSNERADSNTGSDGWSAPIVFYPNGRTSSASLAVRRDYYRVELTLRGLTGTARLGEIQVID